MTLHPSFTRRLMSFATPSPQPSRYLNLSPLCPPSCPSLTQTSFNLSSPTVPPPALLIPFLPPSSSPLLWTSSPMSLTPLFPLALSPLPSNVLMLSPSSKNPLNPTVISNYRPVSLLPFLSKTLERAVYNQLSAHLLQNNLLDPNQSGFRAGHSTETALLAVTEALHGAKSRSLSSVLLLLDLSAAFDIVDHRILLSSLIEMEISGSALTWSRHGSLHAWLTSP
ncbi:hypothetical protein AAFF_G00026760, partial [Aldrovandia affinis]